MLTAKSAIRNFHTCQTWRENLRTIGRASNEISREEQTSPKGVQRKGGGEI